jgi:hypothetical protein
VGVLQIKTTTTGPSQDADGYQFAVDGAEPQPIGLNVTTDLANTAVGLHSVVLSNVANNCTVDDASKSATVIAGTTVTVTFNITCGATTGSIRVATTTTGENLDDGYQFAIDGGSPQPVAANGDQTVADVAAGSHTVVLSGIAGNCTVDDASQNATVTSGATATVAFNITCGTTTGSIRVATTTTGESLDDGYQFAIDGGSPQSIVANGDQTVGGFAPGSHAVVLSGIAGNCSGDASKNVTVAPGETSDVNFSITCTSTVPDASKSSLAADPKDIVAGTGSSTIKVTVKNDGGKQLSGVSVTPSSSGSGNTFSPTSATTGPDGVATFSFSSTVAEDKTISASAGGVDLTHTETITVSARPTTTAITGVTPEPSTSGLSIHVTFTVTAQGGGTPTGGTVTIFSLQESGVGCTVDVGVGSCDFVLNTTGTHSLQATYSGDAQFEESSDPDGQSHVVN